MLNKKSRYLLITMLVFLSIAFDQISKIWVRNNFESYSEKSIIGDVFTLIKVENTGAFLGMGSELSCLLYTSPSPRDGLLSRMPSSA